MTGLQAKEVHFYPLSVKIVFVLLWTVLGMRENPWSAHTIKEIERFTNGTYKASLAKWLPKPT